MFDPDRREQDPTNSEPRTPAPTRSSVLESPSLFVASVVEALRGRRSDAAQVCAEHLSRHGALTGADFSALIDTLPHPSHTSELVWAYSYLSREAVTVEFGQGLPAFLKLAHKCLIDSSDDKGVTARRVARVLDRMLDARVGSADIEEVFDVVVGDGERCLLQSILERVDQTRAGYWECVELLGALFPDPESLEDLLRAVDRLGPGPHRREALMGVQRTIAAIGAAEFVASAEFVAQALGECQRIGDNELLRAAADGLSSHLVGRVDELINLLHSFDENLSRFACRICVSADRGKDVELDEALRHTLANTLKVVRVRFEYVSAGGRFVEEPLTALGHISPQHSDIEQLGAVIQERLERGKAVSSELVGAYASGLARIEKEDGIVALPPLSVKRFKALDGNPSQERFLDRHPRVVTGQETDDDLECLALDISDQTNFEKALKLCREMENLLDVSLLSSRRGETATLFSDVDQALQFARHHARLAAEGPAEFAAVLLPELLSAVACGRAAQKRGGGETIGECAVLSLASLAKLAAHDTNIRELALARLSSVDWEFLSRLHKMNPNSFSRSYPELGLSGIAVRAVLDEDVTWQKDLLEWWGTIDPRARHRMEPNGLAFITVVAERGRPGTVWELLRALPLSSGPAYEFSDIGLALLANPEDAFSRVCTDILSPKGDDLGRALRLAQLMAPHCDEAQREHLRVATKTLLDEMGILGVEAVATLGALSRTREDALLLLTREPALGFDEKVYRISCARAAAKILRNIERSANG